jgi:thiamine transport system substrate-binding protein
MMRAPRISGSTRTVALIAVAALGACAGDDGEEPAAITLVAYDSFPTEGFGVNDALAAFTDDTGIAVELLIAGDAGTMVSKAALTAGNPEGDVMFGVDNTFLSRAVDAGVFEPYEADALDAVPAEFTALVPGHEATPVDYGDVCINYDKAWFAERGLEPPADLEALTDAAYAELLVVENPATSSPGMAFVLATIAEFGEDGWLEYWRRLRDNGVEVVDGWTEAYYERFSHAGGPRPLVVSYGSSPPAEVIAANPPLDEPPTGVLPETCFRQVEFAGVLAGTDALDAARELVDFLLSEEFQSELPLSLYVYPANRNTELPAAFTEEVTLPDASASIDPATIAAGRDRWIDAWTETVLR